MARPCRAGDLNAEPGGGRASGAPLTAASGFQNRTCVDLVWAPDLGGRGVLPRAEGSPSRAYATLGLMLLPRLVTPLVCVRFGDTRRTLVRQQRAVAREVSRDS
jgi:hypothetical protein